VSLIRGDALTIPLADDSVDLIVTSPPYFALRSYTDEGEHYAGQLGSEATPAAFIDALIGVTGECVRVLKPSGSLFVNLGDKYAGSGGHNNSGISDHGGANGDRGPSAYNQASDGVRTKSLMGLPWRYALACIDDLGLILRAEIIWSKPNGLPESVQDRVRRSHEQWFHFTLEPRYYSAVDEIREAQLHPAGTQAAGTSVRSRTAANQGWALSCQYDAPNPLGKLPGSVWSIPTEPLQVPDDLPQHFAAFPSEFPRRIILGWSPSGICCECGEGRRPVTDVDEPNRRAFAHGQQRKRSVVISGGIGTENLGIPAEERNRRITGESCACPTPDAPTRPAVILDPFAGTGTTVAVANHLGRHGIGIDLSAAYLRLARWRCQDPGLRAKVLRVDKPAPEVPGQMALL
jgi:DNA modification methylase